MNEGGRGLVGGRVALEVASWKVSLYRGVGGALSPVTLQRAMILMGACDPESPPNFLLNFPGKVQD